MAKVIVGVIFGVCVVVAGAALVGAALGDGLMGPAEGSADRDELPGPSRTLPFEMADHHVGAQEYWQASLEFLDCLAARGVTVTAAVPEPDGTSIGFGHTAPPESEAFLTCSAALDPVAIRFGVDRSSHDEADLRTVRDAIVRCLVAGGALPQGVDGEERGRRIDELSHGDPDRLAACYP